MMNDQPRVAKTSIEGLLVVHLPLRGDNRGWFKEHWQRQKMTGLGLPDFGPVQMDVSYNSVVGTTQGIRAEPWDKYVSVANGRAYGAWVDLREGSAFGATFSTELRPEIAVFVPRGVGHGYQTLEADTNYISLVNAHWSPETACTLVNLADPALDMKWPIGLDEAILSETDKCHPPLSVVSPMPPLEIVVIGATGSLGWSLRQLLGDRHVRYLAREDLDFTSSDAIAQYPWSGVGTLINAATFIAADQVDECLGRQTAWQINAAAARDLAQVCIKNDITLVHISTTDVCDTKADDDDGDKDSYSPISVYGQTKAAGELTASLVPQHYILRTHSAIEEGEVEPEQVSGEPGEMNVKAVLSRAIRDILSERPLPGIYSVSGAGHVRSSRGGRCGSMATTSKDPPRTLAGNSTPVQSPPKSVLSTYTHNPAVGDSAIHQDQDVLSPTWTYQRNRVPTYDIVTRANASHSEATTPIFYNCDSPPQADTDWPASNTAPRLRLLRYRNLHIYPRHVLIDPGEARVLPISFKKHRHHAHNGLVHVGKEAFVLRNSSLWTATPELSSRPLYVADTEYPGIFGHDLIEVLTAAWAWKHSDPDSLFATSTYPRSYLIDLLAAAGVPKAAIKFFDTPLQSREVYFPEPPIVARRFVHPVAFELFDRVRSVLAEAATGPLRIYISRSRVTERPLANELAVEDLAREKGFQVIHPQDHSIADQLRFFSSARLIMGSGGSAMHNAVFAKPDARVLVLSSPSWLTVIDCLLDNGMNRLGYVIGAPVSTTGPRRNKGPWTVSINDVRAGMREHFGI